MTRKLLVLSILTLVFWCFNSGEIKMPSWNSWYNPLDNAANVVKGFGSTLTGGAVGSQYNTLSDPKTVYSTGSGTKSGGQVQGVNTGISLPIPMSDYNPNPTFSQFDAQGNRIGGSGGGGTRTPAAPAKPDYDPLDLAMLDSQINMTNSGLGRLPGQLSTGIANLLQSYNRGIGQIGTDRNTAQSQYDTTKLRSEGDYLNSRSGIRQESGNLYNSIQRLLGSAGAGRSTAASILAPFAVGREAASRFGQVQDAFGQNQAGLQTSLDTTMRGLTDAEKQLEEDRRNKERELRGGVEQNKANLTDRLSTLRLQRQQMKGGSLKDAKSMLGSSENRINEILANIDKLSANYANPQLNVARQAFKAPNLAKYDYSRFTGPQLQGGRNPQADYVGPFVNPALRDEDERLQVR